MHAKQEVVTVIRDENGKVEKRWLFIDKNGWPIARIKGRTVINILRILLHTRRIERYASFIKRTGIQINFD